MSQTLYQNRIHTVTQSMVQKKLDALIISDPQSIYYLTGIYNEPYERMYVLYLKANGTMTLFANRLFCIPQKLVDQFSPALLSIVWMTDIDNTVQILADYIEGISTIGIDKQWSARFLVPLMQYKQSVRFTLGSDCVDDARACKDKAEQQLMKEASLINDRCIQKAFSFIKEGISEIEVASFIDKQFKCEGADGPCFETIVSFGANAADPHHSPDKTIVKSGDCVLIDMGCKKDGYCSDMTRTHFFKSAPQPYTIIHDLVRSANEAAERIVKPGVRLCDIDKTARDIISAAGYGANFTHRLGHFCGQSDHEQGDVSAINTSVAKEGMIFSIEPGVYIPGVFGVRIEDLVLVTKDSYELLNHIDKKWHIIN